MCIRQNTRSGYPILITHNITEDNKSNQLLSNALKYETYALLLFIQLVSSSYNNNNSNNNESIYYAEMTMVEPYPIHYL
ncbi:MAG: hypothetical protein JO327_05465 [Nitrososphaeraceae archaeon]|nr:hypothetical protein [Nitrososphaeraceae archaeon]MBV9667563.1 hypothetical protein [Nitrososphaeraceae archaeon]